MRLLTFSVLVIDTFGLPAASAWGSSPSSQADSRLRYYQAAAGLAARRSHTAPDGLLSRKLEVARLLSYCYRGSIVPLLETGRERLAEELGALELQLRLTAAARALPSLP